MNTPAAEGADVGNAARTARTGSVRFARIPLWLYESGAPLQAIAAYGWLHGRYGHHGAMTPSYGTLAKELGVSRGSAIAYVQSLVSVGALRIKVSGAANHRSNTYEIAFDAPFPKPGTGQNTDQSNGVLVSPMTTTGQNTDQLGPELVSPLTRTGQPVGHDIDEVQDNYLLDKTSTTTPPAIPAQAASRDGGGGGDVDPKKDPHNDEARRIIASLPVTHQPGRSGSAKLSAALIELLGLGWPERELCAKLCADLPPSVGNLAALLVARLPDPVDYQFVAATAPSSGPGFSSGRGGTEPCGQCDPIDRRRRVEGMLHPCPVCNATQFASHVTRHGDHRSERQRLEDDWYHKRWEWQQAKNRGEYMPEPINAPDHMYAGGL